MIDLTNEEIVAFWLKVRPADLWSCWLWRGAFLKDGYGQHCIRARTYQAHRLAFFIGTGGINVDLCVLHQCDTPACVNPLHLFQGTRGDNNRDRTAKGRTAAGSQHGTKTKPETVRRGSAHGMSVLTEELVVRIRRAYTPGVTTYKDIALLFDATVSTVGDVIRRKTWAHVP